MCNSLIQLWTIRFIIILSRYTYLVNSCECKRSTVLPPLSFSLDPVTQLPSHLPAYATSKCWVAKTPVRRVLFVQGNQPSFYLGPDSPYQLVLLSLDLLLILMGINSALNLFPLWTHVLPCLDSETLYQAALPIPVHLPTRLGPDTALCPLFSPLLLE